MSARRTDALAFLGYLALAALLFGRHILPHLDSRCLCTHSADPTQFVWAMEWWPHAIGHGLNPVMTHAIWAPKAFDLAAATSVPLPALIATPVTLTLGPLASYNLWILLSPVLAAFLAYRLCRYLTGATAPSVVGGFLFGFSSYMLGQMTGHLHLTLVFLLPLGLHLALRHLDGEIGRTRFVISIAAVFAAQVLIATEVLFTALLFAAVALAAGWFFSPRRRGDLGRLTAGTVAGGVLAAIVVSPFLYYALVKSFPSGLLPESRISLDALNPLVPTPVTRLGRGRFLSVAGTFPGNYSESGGYLSFAIVLLAGWWLARTWQTARTRVLLTVLACAVVCALGTHLFISGHRTISLPWRLLANIHVFGEAVPVRIVVYATLAVAIACAYALAGVAGSLFWRWALAVAGIVLLLPNADSWLFQSRPDDPSFFRSGLYKRYIPHGATVLALPFAQRGFSLLWQARAHMDFALAEGYLGQQPPKDYRTDPAAQQMLAGVADAHTPCLLRSFIQRRAVKAVVLDTATTEVWQPSLAALGLRPQPAGGVLVYRVPASLAAPAGC